MLVPATAEDLKKHGQITITPKIEASEGGKDDENKEENLKIAEVHENGSIITLVSLFFFFFRYPISYIKY